MGYGWKTVCAWCQAHMKGAVDAPNITHSICTGCSEPLTAECVELAERDTLDNLDMELPPHANPFGEACAEDLLD